MMPRKLALGMDLGSFHSEIGTTPSLLFLRNIPHHLTWCSCDGNSQAIVAVVVDIIKVNGQAAVDGR